MGRPSLRGKILEAAVDGFRDRGFSACSVADITQAAGVPKGSLYNHFPTKEQLGIEVLAHYAEECRVPLLRNGDDGPLARVRAHFEYLATLQAESVRPHCSVGHLALDSGDDAPLLRQAVADTMSAWGSELAYPLREAQARGELASDLDADMLARFLVNAWEGAHLRVRMTGDLAPIAQFLEFGLKRLLGA